ncbi:hypothetical protein [Desulfotomaculum sp. 1211_IL3151]|uniref:hypothetical protein n=1 Tax=Desulfotomaculum sp. 1211_IL3151 TaxID=3084055 RepID=UPI002FDB3B03
MSDKKIDYMSELESVTKCLFCKVPGEEIGRDGIFVNYTCPKCKATWQIIRIPARVA